MERVGDRTGAIRRAGGAERVHRRRRALRDHRTRRRGEAAHRLLRRQEELDRAMRGVRHVHPHGLAVGDVVWARVPFEERPDYKLRPVVVLSATYHDVVALRCTTKVERGLDLGHVALSDLDAAGLSEPTVVDPVGAVVIADVDLLDRTGRCSEADWSAITEARERVVASPGRRAGRGARRHPGAGRPGPG